MRMKALPDVTPKWHIPHPAKTQWSSPAWGIRTRIARCGLSPVPLGLARLRLFSIPPDSRAAIRSYSSCNRRRYDSDCGRSVIGVEAGRTLLLERDGIVDLANRSKIVTVAC